jgi:hypothetical protein
MRTDEDKVSNFRQVSTGFLTAQFETVSEAGRIGDQPRLVGVLAVR